MDNKEFDRIIKEKLNDLSSNHQNDDWDVFKEIWEHDVDQNPEDLSDEALDNKFKQDLKNLRVPYNSFHWIALQERLRFEKEFQQKLFSSKAFELLMLLFLVFIVLQLVPLNKKIYQLKFKENTSFAIDQRRSTSASENTVKASENSAILQETVNKKNYPVHSELQEAYINAPKDFSLSSLKENRLSLPIVDLINGFNAIQSTQLNNAIISDIHAPHATIPMAHLDIPKRPLGLPNMGLKTLNSSEEKSYVNISVGPRINLVNSPFDPIYKVNPHNTITTNYSVNVNYERELGKIHLLAGLGYTDISYEPKNIEERYQDKGKINEVSLENIAYKVVNIPLGIKYVITESDTKSLYAIAGLNLNLIGFTDYKVLDVPAENVPVRTPSFQENPNENSKLALKPFNDVIMQGGSLKDNLFASASVGFGFSQNLNSQISYFIEPKYNQFINNKGIGPNNDRVHGISLDLGVRFTL